MDNQYIFISIERNQIEGMHISFEEIDLAHYKDIKWRHASQTWFIGEEDLNSVVEFIREQSQNKEVIFSSDYWSQKARDLYYAEENNINLYMHSWSIMNVYSGDLSCLKCGKRIKRDSMEYCNQDCPKEKVEYQLFNASDKPRCPNEGNPCCCTGQCMDGLLDTSLQHKWRKYIENTI